MKHAIYKGEVGLFSLVYIDRKQDLIEYPYIKESSLPVVVNSRGGYHTFIEEYEKESGFLYIKTVKGYTAPLTLEERFPKNATEFNYGWIDPSGNTYSCDKELHSEFAYEYLKLKGDTGVFTESELEKKGWAKVTTDLLHNHEPLICTANFRLTKKQIDTLYKYDLIKTPNSRALVKYSLSED